MVPVTIVLKHQVTGHLNDRMTSPGWAEAMLYYRGGDELLICQNPRTLITSACITTV